MNCIVMKAPSIHYILKDHLGSWTTITDSEGNVEQELSFDAWGNLRNPATWSGSFSGASSRWMPMWKTPPMPRPSTAMPTAATTLCATPIRRDGTATAMVASLGLSATTPRPDTIPTTPTMCFGEGACIRVLIVLRGISTERRLRVRGIHREITAYMDLIILLIQKGMLRIREAMI